MNRARKEARKRVRALERRMNAMVEAAHGSPLTFRGEREIVLFIEGKDPAVAQWDALVVDCFVEADIMFDELTILLVERTFSAGEIPGLFIVDGWAHVQPVSVYPLGRKGAA